MNWLCLPFAELGSERLYAILQRRAEVFVVEQRCFYQDVDGLDPQAMHLMAWDGNQLLAYARLLPPGLKARSPVIGRVLTAPAARGSGLGHELAARAVQECERLWPGLGITLFAQAHLQAYYARAGFVGVGEVFDEDGIAHREMHKTPNTEP
jgi:ElaA protein